MKYDIIIVGGSYSGLAAGMALGRALKRVLIIDSGLPCNRQTPYSHNFLTRDGEKPAEIAAIGLEQVLKYDTVSFTGGLAVSGRRVEDGFEIVIESGERFFAGRLIFATGIRDITPAIEGVSECWGISVIHCPYCHGYEVRNEKTGILANGDDGFEMSTLISNWTLDLTVYTNGASLFGGEQRARLSAHGIVVDERVIVRLEHVSGQLRSVVFEDGSQDPVTAMYVRSPFEQHCKISADLGCELTPEGYLKVDMMQETSIPGVFACGDNTSRMRTVAHAVSSGTMAGVAASRKIIFEQF
jgi:thioredoxin reductase